MKPLKIDRAWDLLEVVHLERWSVYGVKIYVLAIASDKVEMIDIAEWSICGCCRLDGFYCIYLFLIKE